MTEVRALDLTLSRAQQPDMKQFDVWAIAQAADRLSVRGQYGYILSTEG